MRTALYIKSNIPVTVKTDQTFLRNGIKSFFAESTTDGIIVVGLIYKRSVEISKEHFSVVLEPLISSPDPRVKTSIVSDFNINLVNYNLSPSDQNFINQMISKNFVPIINLPTRVTPHSYTLIDNIFCNRVDEVEQQIFLITIQFLLEINYQPYLMIQYQSTTKIFQMRTYQNLKIHYEI